MVSKTKALSEEAEKIEEFLKCHICLDVAEQAMEMSCCHNIFCESCIITYAKSSSSCPICRAPSIAFSPSEFIRQIVNDKMINCPFGCKQQFKRSQIDLHKPNCQNIEYFCAIEKCEFMGKREAVIIHLFEAHQNSVLEAFDISSAIKKVPAKISAIPEEVKSFKFHLLKATKNSAGFDSLPGLSGKFYCGKALDGEKCKCCNGSCGPTNGCNCSHCMELDIKLRQLPKGYLVNTDGVISVYDKEKNTFWCNRIKEPGEERCVAKAPCPGCIRLRENKARYERLLV